MKRKQQQGDSAEMSSIPVPYVNFDVSNVNWSNSSQVRALTRSILFKNFNLKVKLHKQRLCPPLPNRINYLRWLQKLTCLENHVFYETIYGLDIGTGASCIYPLLGSRLYGWKFLASDIDPVAIRYSKKNVEINVGMSNCISIVKVPAKNTNQLQQLLLEHFFQRTAVETKSELQNNNLFTLVRLWKSSGKDLPPGPILQALSQSSLAKVVVESKDDFYHRILSEASSSIPNKGDYRHPIVHFSMCNPPFYDLGETIESNKKTACTGSSVEMRTLGGEVAFVTAMIVDSLILRERLLWYTSMLGKKSSVKAILKVLAQEGITNVRSTRFTQGRTMRWGIAWSFTAFGEDQITDVDKVLAWNRLRGKLRHTIQDPNSNVDSINHTWLNGSIAVDAFMLEQFSKTMAITQVSRAVRFANAWEVLRGCTRAELWTIGLRWNRAPRSTLRTTNPIDRSNYIDFTSMSLQDSPWTREELYQYLVSYFSTRINPYFILELLELRISDTLNSYNSSIIGKFTQDPRATSVENSRFPVDADTSYAHRLVYRLQPFHTELMDRYLHNDDTDEQQKEDVNSDSANSILDAIEGHGSEGDAGMMISEGLPRQVPVSCMTAGDTSVQMEEWGMNVDELGYSSPPDILTMSKNSLATVDYEKGDDDDSSSDGSESFEANGEEEGDMMNNNSIGSSSNGSANERLVRVATCSASTWNSSSILPQLYSSSAAALPASSAFIDGSSSSLPVGIKFNVRLIGEEQSPSGDSMSSMVPESSLPLDPSQVILSRYHFTVEAVLSPLESQIENAKAAFDAFWGRLEQDLLRKNRKSVNNSCIARL